MINGPGYKGASLFGALANAQRGITGCTKIAMREGRNSFGLPSNSTMQMLSLPKACDLGPDDLSRRIAETIYLNRLGNRVLPSVFVYIMSTAGLDLRLDLILRIHTLGHPVVLMLGVVSRIGGHNVSVSGSGLSRLLNVPMIRTITIGAGKVRSLVGRLSRGGLFVAPCRSRLDRFRRIGRVAGRIVLGGSDNSGEATFLSGVFLRPMLNLMVLALAVFIVFRTMFV